jgi:hypothetical protein
VTDSRRHGGGVVAHRTDLRTAQVQHRRRERVHRQVHPNPPTRLHLRPALNRDPFLRRQQARRGSRRAERRRGRRVDPNRRTANRYGSRDSSGDSDEGQHGPESLPADILAYRLAARRDESVAVRGARRAHRRRDEDRPDALSRGQARRAGAWRSRQTSANFHRYASPLYARLYSMIAATRIRNQLVLAAPVVGRQNGGQETDKGCETRQGRAAAYQYRLDVDGRTRVERPGGLGEDTVDFACVHGDRGEGCAFAAYREALAASR